MKKFRNNNLLLLPVLSMIIISASSWKNADPVFLKYGLKTPLQWHKEQAVDTTPQKTRIIIDLDRELDKLEKAEAKLEAAIEKIDWKKIEQEISNSIKEIDTKKIEKELREALRNIEEARIEINTRDVMAQIDLKKLDAEMKKLEIEIKTLKPTIEKELEEARRELQKAKEEIKAQKKEMQ